MIEISTREAVNASRVKLFPVCTFSASYSDAGAADQLKMQNSSAAPPTITTPVTVMSDLNVPSNKPFPVFRGQEHVPSSAMGSVPLQATVKSQTPGSSLSPSESPIHDASSSQVLPSTVTDLPSWPTLRPTPEPVHFPGLTDSEAVGGSARSMPSMSVRCSRE